MTEKSYVSMEKKVCQVCGVEYSAGILLDRHLRNRFDRETVTGFGMCEDHQKLLDDGYLALVGIDPSKSDFLPNGHLRPEGAYRTGDLAHIKRDVARGFFNIPISEDVPMFFVEVGVIDKLREVPVKPAGEEET